MASDVETVPTEPRDWNGLIGNAFLVDWFAAAIERGRLTGSFLFVGPPGVGKSTVAKLLAKTLLCESLDVRSRPPQPCCNCSGCVQVAANTHPDLIQVRKPKDKTQIPIDLLVGPPDARMQEGFCRDVRMKSSRGGRKVAVLHDADTLNEEGANCLLKTLEEPPPDTVILLIGTSEQRQLPTIRSRCQIVRFRPLDTSSAWRLFTDVHQIKTDRESVEAALETTVGDVHAARRLLQSDDSEWRAQFAAMMTSDNADPVSISRSVTSRVEGAGKDTAKRRDTLRDAFAVGIQALRQQIREQLREGAATPSDHLMARLDRCVRAAREVERSANQSTLIECFAADISNGVTGDRGSIGS